MCSSKPLLPLNRPMEVGRYRKARGIFTVYAIQSVIKCTFFGIFYSESNE